MLLRVQNLRKTYPGPDGELVVLNGINMSLDAGETLALTGESGEWKKYVVAFGRGLDQPTSGLIEIDGSPISSLDDAGRAEIRRTKVGVIFQQFNLIPSLTVASNIAFQAKLAGRYDAQWIDTLSDRLGLNEQLSKYPENLSGGQQQRVAIARTLAAKPALVLADEPTGNLDEATADAVLQVMLDLVAQTQTGLLMVTHSERLAGEMSRRLNLRAGQVA